MNILSIKNLHATVDGKEILKGIDLEIGAGEIHAIMGPNGSGKSTLAYTLAGLNNPRTGWGRDDETWNFMQALGALGGETWFQLGDRDLAMHVLRTQALRSGMSLSQITRQLSRRLGLRHSLIPMSDTPVRTRVRVAGGELDFQDYFVRQRCKPRVQGFRFVGAARAQVPAPLAELMASGRVDAVVICPSNPYVSVAPILAVPAIRRW